MPEHPAPTNGSAADLATKRCVVCKESIQRGALVCVECNNWQDRSRYLARWSGLLTAVLAILPLWTGAVSLYNIAFGSAARVRVQPLTCGSDTVTLAVTNEGGQAGIVGKSTVMVRVDGQAASSALVLDSAELPKVVAPQATMVLSLGPTIENVKATLPTPSTGAACEYAIVTEIRGFDGSASHAETTCSCTTRKAAP